MFTRTVCICKAFPDDYRADAEKLFPQAGFPEGQGPSREAVESFAITLGIAHDYKKLWNAEKSGMALGEFLNHFQNNLELLIQKTWVEKADETRKEDLLDQVRPFTTLIEKGNYHEALNEFGAILEELAYLLFGTQSEKDDFADYVLRIDPQMGLFWWYGAQIHRGSSWAKHTDRDVLYALLLLGICYLTDF